MEIFAFLAISYLIGSIPFGLLLTKAAGLGDIRSIGSGSIGATNVLRTGNKKLAALTLLLDGGKGALAVLLIDFMLSQTFMDCRTIDCLGDCTCYPFNLPFDIRSYYLMTGLAAIIGHCFPIWLKFKGGKGVAAAAGVLLAAIPYVGLLACATWLVTALITRISSLSALVTCALAPVLTFFIYGNQPALLCLLLAIVIFIKHHANIKRLIKGEEPKIGAKK